MKRLSVILLVAIAAASCVRERVVEEQGLVSLQFRANGLATRAVTDPEWAVGSMDVLVFQQVGGVGDFTFQYHVVGKNVAQEQNSSAYFDALLTPCVDPVRLLMVANAADGALDGIATGATEAEVRASLTSTGFDFSQGITMTGVAQLPSLSKDTGMVRFPLIRSVAKATVNVDLRPGTPAFVLTSVAIYRTSTVWSLFPDASSVQNEETAPVITAPSLPATATSVTRPTVAIDASQSYTGYLAGSMPDADAATATCVVVGGIFEGDTVPTYYRLDFGLDTDPANLPGQVLRNYWYELMIVEANASGWDTPDEAAAYPPSGLQLTVTPWDGGENTEFYFGEDNYIKLSRDSIYLSATVDRTDSVVVTTSEVPFTITSTRAPGAGRLDTSVAGSTFSTDKIKYTLIPIAGAPAGEQQWELEATALTAESINDNLELRAAGTLMTIRIKVRRDPPPSPVVVNDRTKRTIRLHVLGTSTFGSFRDDPDEGLPAVVRDKDYFGPTGTVECAGFQLSGENKPSASQLANLLPNVDILVNTYNYDPDPTESALIYNWLQEPGHVMFMTKDSSGTVPNLSPYMDAGMVWENDANLDDPEGYGSGYTGLKTADPTADNQPFMQGVFGSVYDCLDADPEPYDAVTMFMDLSTATNSADIIPLLVANGNSGKNNNIAMTAIDPTRRVIYMGEVLHFHDIYEWWSKPVPFDSADYMNVLMSNLMAWAVDTVMTQNYDVPGMTDI